MNLLQSFFLKRSGLYNVTLRYHAFISRKRRVIPTTKLYAITKFICFMRLPKQIFMRLPKQTLSKLYAITKIVPKLFASRKVLRYQILATVHSLR